MAGRNPICVAAWPECEDGMYDPRCCRFPKSCSCAVPTPPIADDPAPPFSTSKLIEHNDGRHVTRDTACPVCWTTAHINELTEA